jgi:hypothetical protein
MISASESSEEENASDEVLSACAIVNSDVVSDSCSVRLWERSLSVVEVTAVAEAAALALPAAANAKDVVVAGASGPWRQVCRARNDEAKSSSREPSAAAGKTTSMAPAASTRKSGAFSERVSGGVPSSSMSSEGVSSPRRSSPSDESPSMSYFIFGC